MDKKLFGIKLSTYVNLFICFVVAFFVWFIARYIELSALETAALDHIAERKYI